jgi:hypothetical protein
MIHIILYRRCYLLIRANHADETHVLADEGEHDSDGLQMTCQIECGGRLLGFSAEMERDNWLICEERRLDAAREAAIPHRCAR